MSAMGDSELLRALAPFSAIPIDRLRCLPEDARAKLQDVRAGVLVFAALWSGPFMRAFREITSALADLDHGIEVLVVDIDSRDLYEAAGFGTVPRGVGEVAFVRDGQFVGTFVWDFDRRGRPTGPHRQRFEGAVRELLG